MKPLFILSLCCLCLQAFGEEYTYRLASPDKNLEVNISVGQKITYSVRHKDRVLLNASPIGLVFLDRTLGADAKVIRKKESSFTEDIQSPHYRVPSFTVTYNELDLKMKGNYGVVFRAYNEGMAYRFYTTMKDSVIVEDEIASFNFPENYTSYMAYSTAGVKSDQYAMAFQNTYTVSTVKEAEADNITFLPITLDCGDEVKMTLLESDLESYPGMFIEKGNGESALLVEGARRVGKSYLVKEFGEREYRSCIIVNFSSDRVDPRPVFEKNAGDLDMLFDGLSALYGTRLYRRESLIVFDEIQLYLPAREMIKTLVEDKRYDYIETGSLVSIKTKMSGNLIPSEEDGMELHVLDAFKPVDVADLDARDKINVQVCNAYHISPENVGFRTGNKSSIQAYKEQLWNVELRPYIVAFEQALNKALPSALGEVGSWVEANLDAQLRGTTSEQYQALSTATGRPFMATDEARRIVNLPTLGDGYDRPITPLNVTEGGQPSPQDGGRTQNAQEGASPNGEE